MAKITYTLSVEADAPITIENSREVHRALDKLGLKMTNLRLDNRVHNHNIQAQASSDAAVAEALADANIPDRPIDRRKLFFGDETVIEDKNTHVSEQKMDVKKPNSKWQTGTND